MTTLELRVNSPVQALTDMEALYAGVVEPHTRTGAAGVITWQTENAWLRQKMRGKLHVILSHISGSVWFVDPVTRANYRYSLLAWKEHFKNEFLTPVIEERTVKSTGEIKLKARRISTEELSDDDYSLFLTRVEAYAIVDLGLELPDE